MARQSLDSEPLLARSSTSLPSSERRRASSDFSSTAAKLSFITLTIVLIASFPSEAEGAPAHCRACKDCPNPKSNLQSSNATDTDLLELLEASSSNRTKREVSGGRGVEVRSCASFPIEVLLIPLAIGLIPIALCALLFCTCYCGPKESRGKMPDNVLGMKRSASKVARDEMELEYKDGYVQRKDSKMTKFSTTVAYIEPPRRESVWSATTESLPSSPIRKTPSTDSLKRTRFSDTVHVCEGEASRGPQE